MKKIYNYEKATVYVLNLDTYDHERFEKATRDFLRKVINGGKK